MKEILLCPGTVVRDPPLLWKCENWPQMAWSQLHYLSNNI